MLLCQNDAPDSGFPLALPAAELRRSFWRIAPTLASRDAGLDAERRMWGYTLRRSNPGDWR